MTPPGPDISLLSVFVAALTIIIGPQLAVMMGTYSLILFGWVAGVAIGLFRLPKESRIPMWGYVLVSFIITIGITVPGAEIVASYVPSAEAKGMLFPVAVALPAVGHSWLDIAGWVLLLARRRIERKEESEADK